MRVYGTKRDGLAFEADAPNLNLLKIVQMISYLRELSSDQIKIKITGLADREDAFQYIVPPSSKLLIAEAAELLGNLFMIEPEEVQKYAQLCTQNFLKGVH